MDETTPKQEERRRRLERLHRSRELRLKRQEFILKTVVWAGVAVFAILAFSPATWPTRAPPPLERRNTLPDRFPAPASGAPKDVEATADAFRKEIEKAGPGLGVEIDATELARLLIPLVKTGKVAPEAANKLVDILLETGKPIAIDAAHQVLAWLLRAAAVQPNDDARGGAVVQVCAPTPHDSSTPQTVLKITEGSTSRADEK